eukprot:SAG11_NODE_8069_length_1063_cov_1.304979_2_plen_49_part_00
MQDLLDELSDHRSRLLVAILEKLEEVVETGEEGRHYRLLLVLHLCLPG